MTQITTFQQTQHPEIGATITEISQDIVYANFANWFIACIRLDNCRRPMDFRTFKGYYYQDLTPKQAVNKYFL